jgi:hypothetical protein
MNLNKTLSEILNKTYFYDFTFSYEFIENLKFECMSLYDILVVLLNKKWKIIPDKIKEIQLTTNYVINYYIKYCSIYNVFFNHNQHITELQALYDELIDVEDDNYNNIHNLKYLIQNIFIKSLNNYHPVDIIKIDKYDKLNHITDIFSCKNYDKTYELMNDYEKEFNCEVSLFKLYKSVINFSTNKDMRILIDGLKQLFGKIEHSMINNIYRVCCYKKLTYYYNDHRMCKNYDKIENLVISKPKITNYNNYIDYEYNILIHTIKSDIQKRDKIENAGLGYHLYLKDLLNTKSEFISTNIISDYFSFIYNNKNYELVVKMYKKYNIEEKLIIVNHPLVKTNIFVMILKSLFQTNRLISTYQCKILLDKYDINKIEDNIGIIKKNLEMIQKFNKHIEQREYYIKSIGYDIVNEPTNTEDIETCLICMEDIEEDEICFIKCNNCHKKLGHINCVSSWLINRRDCPNCRFKKK